MRLDKLLLFLQTIANKEQAGNTLSITQFNNQLEAVNLWLFKMEYDKISIEALQAQKPIYRALQTSSSLRPFKSKVSLTLSGGEADLPSDYVHYASLMGKKDGLTIRIDILSDDEMEERRTGIMNRPLSMYPAAQIIGSKLVFFPSTIDDVELIYYRVPTTPYYDYAIDEDDNVLYMSPADRVSYSAPLDEWILESYINYPSVATTVRFTVTYPIGSSTSVTVNSVTKELEWESYMHIQIAKIILQNMGINLRDQQLEAYAKQMPTGV